jgi:uncharacterized protein YdaU (DUF1376 family)
MPLHVDDYLNDTLDLDADQHGCYLLMLMLAWRRPGGALPNDMKWLKRALGAYASDMHGNRFNRIVPRLLAQFFTLGQDGNYRQKRLTKELEIAEKISGKARENAEKRWGNAKETVGKPLPRINENNALADATAMPLPNTTLHNNTEEKKEKTYVVTAQEAPVTTCDGKLEIERKAGAFFDEHFWPAYPKRDGTNSRKNARRVYVGEVTKGADPETVQDGLQAYRAHCTAKGFLGTSFVKTAEAWLRGAMWEQHQPINAPAPPKVGLSGKTDAELEAIYRRKLANGRGDENLPGEGRGVHANGEASLRDRAERAGGEATAARGLGGLFPSNARSAPVGNGKLPEGVH